MQAMVIGVSEEGDRKPAQLSEAQAGLRECSEISCSAHILGLPVSQGTHPSKVPGSRWWQNTHLLPFTSSLNDMQILLPLLS